MFFLVGGYKMRRATKIVGIAWGAFMVTLALSFLFVALIYGIVDEALGSSNETGTQVLSYLFWIFFAIGMACFVPAIFSFLVAAHSDPKQGSAAGKTTLGVLAIIFGAIAPGVLEIILGGKMDEKQ